MFPDSILTLTNRLLNIRNWKRILNCMKRMCDLRYFDFFHVFIYFTNIHNLQHAKKMRDKEMAQIHTCICIHTHQET